MTQLFEAAKFATIRHQGQVRGGVGVPYVTHCFDVADRIAKVGCHDEDTLIAGILHDILEDTDTQDYELDKFGILPGGVTMIVRDLTLPVDCRKDFEKKLRFQTEKMKSMNIRGVLVKIADKTSNVNDLLDDPPKWGMKAIRGYTESAREVVHAAQGVGVLNADPDFLVWKDLLLQTFDNTYLRLSTHFGWDKES